MYWQTKIPCKHRTTHIARLKLLTNVFVFYLMWKSDLMAHNLLQKAFSSMAFWVRMLHVCLCCYGSHHICVHFTPVSTFLPTDLRYLELDLRNIVFSVRSWDLKSRNNFNAFKASLGPLSMAILMDGGVGISKECDILRKKCDCLLPWRYIGYSCPWGLIATKNSGEVADFNLK